jgi:integrase
MNTLRQALNEYLALRQAMGFKLHEESRLLPRFIDFLDAHGETFITTDLAVRWATQCRTTQPAEWARRLRFVRIFARYRSATDPRTQIPPTGLLPYRARRAHTYVTALGLLAVTGMRISELVALDNDDVDLAYGQLTIRDAKFGKSRWLPLHSSTQQALQRYVQRRDQQYPSPCSSSFFVSEQGTRLTSCRVRATFVQLSRQIGLRGLTDSHGPRLHDFRHRFAVQTLLRWYQEGADVEQHLPELSTYLGHVKVSDTYWYLSATPELLQLALQRSEQGDTHDR